MRISFCSMWTILFVSTTVSAAVSRNLQTSTPRYTTEVNILGLEFLKENIDGEGVSRKLSNKRIDFVVHKGSENHFQLKLNNKSKVLPVTTTTKPTLKKVVKPTSNKKIISPKPLRVIVEKPKNQTTGKKKITIRPNPIRISTEKLKFQNGHYKNYTKFRIKPLNKQSDIIPVVSTFAPELTPPSYDGLQISPEISTYSPPFSIGSIPQSQNQYENSMILNSLSPNSNPFGVPISQVVIQSLPVNSDSNTDIKADLPSDCPAFQITSNLYNPQRQGCSDLNVVINSQLAQNSVPERQPEVPADAVADDPVEAADPVEAVPAAAEPVASQAASPAAGAPAAAAPPSQGGGGSPIGGGLPSLPELPQLSLPDLKGLFDILGVLWNGLRSVFGFLANPYLYLVPIALSFGLGFIIVLIKVKWFVVVPALAFYGYLNRDAGKPEIVHHKYPLKVIHHDNGWFYNQDLKTYENILEYMHPKKIPVEVPRLIGKFEERYEK